MNRQSYIQPAKARVWDDPRWRPWIIAACLAYFVTAVVFAATDMVANREDLKVFGSFWEAGRHLDYQMHPLVWINQLGMSEINLNPPMAFPLFQLFALFDPYAAQVAWFFVSAAIYLGLVWTMRDASAIQLFWLLTMPIIVGGMSIGQIYVLLFAIGVAVQGQMRRGNTLAAAALLGLLVALKPNFALWGLVAFAGGYRREAVVAGSVTGLLAVGAALLYGADSYSQWLAAAAADTHYLLPHDVSIGGTFRRFGIPAMAPGIALGIAAVTVWAWRTRPTLYDLTPVAMVAAVLCSPLGWMDYVLVTIAFFVDRPWSLPVIVAAFLMCTFHIAWDAMMAGHLLLSSAAFIVPVLVMLAEFVRRSGLRRPIQSFQP